MVFLHFPSGHTDEELMLKAKYAKLKKKKKALQNYQNPKPEPEKLSSLKRPLEPKDAKEYAKKLILSGKIFVPKQPLTPKTVFKKPQGLLRKLSETRAAAVVGPIPNPNGGSFLTGAAVTGVSSGIHYKPFTPSHEPAAGYSTGSARGIPRLPSRLSTEDPGGEPMPGPSRRGGGGRDFGPHNRRNFGHGHAGAGNGLTPTKGNTVYVHGLGLTEQMCRESFNNCGSILNVSMELEKNCGFITFDRLEAAEKAIQTMNNTFAGNTKFTVSFARRQIPVTEIINDAPSAAAWTALAAQPSQKTTHKDKRQIQVYDEI